MHKYVSYAFEQFDAHNIIIRIQRLNDKIASEGFTVDAGETLNHIDKQVTEFMLRAEDRLSPDTTTFAFSVELEHQMRKVRLIKCIKDLMHLNFPLETYIKADLEDVAVEVIRVDNETIISALTRERQKLSAMQEESWEIRERHQDDIRERAAEEKNTSVENIARDMKQREVQKRTYERFGNSLKSSNFSKVTRLGIPKHLLHSSTEEI